MTQQEEFCAVALKEVGTKESPANSNKVKYNDKNGQPWCGYFVMWCAKQVGLKIPSVIYTPAGVEGFKGIGRWSNAETAKPSPGDIVFFDFPGGEKTDHVGIVIKDNLDGTVTTIEGNTSESGSQSNGGQVLQKIRAYKKNNRKKLPVYVSGFGKPKWRKV